MNREMAKNHPLTLTWKDFFFAGINGAFFGLLLPVVLRTFNVELAMNYFLVVVFFIVLAIFGVYVGFLLGKVKPFFFQLAKFGATGAANFALDIGVLSLLVTLFFRDASAIPNTYFVTFKVISFSLATINSYLWNKFWSFNDKDTRAMTKEFGKFLSVSLVGMALNATVAGLFNYYHFATVDAKTWAAISAMVGAVAVLLWNFVGYKFFVFEK